MTKGELIKGLAELKGVKKKEAEEMISLVDEVIELATKCEGKTKVGSYFTVQMVSKKEKKGEMTRINEAGQKVKEPFTTPAHDEIIIKRTQAAKRV
ncbi:MAG: HU family DNA-binding protein [Bacilli bacterium]